jgi:ribose 1,5-bisphosphokinase
MTHPDRKTGRLIAVVGPSGAGKDSVMAGLIAARPGLSAVRRTITRASEAGGEAGGEDHDPLNHVAFAARKAAGDFALTWAAHGLFYGIPRAALAPLDDGHDLLANLSRNVLRDAALIVCRMTVLHITASPATLSRRLATRGRESEADIAARLFRQTDPLPPGLDTVKVANDGTLAQTVVSALAALYPERA